MWEFPCWTNVILSNVIRCYLMQPVHRGCYSIFLPKFYRLVFLPIDIEQLVFRVVIITNYDFVDCKNFWSFCCWKLIIHLTNNQYWAITRNKSFQTFRKSKLKISPHTGKWIETLFRMLSRVWAPDLNFIAFYKSVIHIFRV